MIACNWHERMRRATLDRVRGFSEEMKRASPDEMSQGQGCLILQLLATMQYVPYKWYHCQNLGLGARWIREGNLSKGSIRLILATW